MSFQYQRVAFIVSRWWGNVRRELVELRIDLVELWRWRCQRLRSDPVYRSTILQSLLRGLLNVLGRGPRATVLWLVALVCEVVLELLRSLQGGFDGPEYA